VRGRLLKLGLLHSNGCGSDGLELLLGWFLSRPQLTRGLHTGDDLLNHLRRGLLRWELHGVAALGWVAAVLLGRVASVLGTTHAWLLVVIVTWGPALSIVSVVPGLVDTFARSYLKVTIS
jgi:hypothetical protein